MQFTEDKTIVVMFDTEWYVPRNIRSSSLSTLKSNPLIRENQYLGGVFYRFYPVRDKNLRYEAKEIFVKDFTVEQEKSVLMETYKYFDQSWNLLKGKSEVNPDLITIGIGQSRFDLPSLYARSVLMGIEKPEILFEIYLKTKPVDLSDVVIPYINRNRPRLMYPISTNTMISRFGIGSDRKESGKNVWDLVESRNFEGIKERVRSEVSDMWKIYNKLITDIFGSR